MKKKLLCLWLLLLCLTGCAFSLEKDQIFQKITEFTLDSNQETITEKNDAIEQGNTSQSEYTEFEQDHNGEEQQSISEDDNNSATPDSLPAETVLQQQGNDYYYNHLSYHEQLIYNEIYQIIIQHETEVSISSIDQDEINKVYNYVLYDHPEIFYVSGYSYIQHTMDDQITQIDLSPSYLYSLDEIETLQVMIDQYVTQCLQGIPEYADEYEKTKYVYEYLIMNTIYDLTAEDNQNIISVFINGKSVCQGYAKATQYLLNKLDIEATIVTGTIKETKEGHSWNLVLINGEYYYMDTTWGDAYYATDNETDQQGKVPEISYDYLNITTNEILRTHSISSNIPVPECNSLQDNYYVHQGAYCTEVDAGQIESLFLYAYKNNSSYVTMKSADETVYQDLEQFLLNEQNIFNYLQNSTSISYTKNDNTLTFSFWI